MDIISGIYLIVNIVNGKKYVGSAVNLNKRWNGHAELLRKNQHHNPHLQSAYNKYGKDSFVFTVLEQCGKEFLISREQFFIDEINPEYNICPTAGNTLGRKFSEETKKKMSETRKGHVFFSQEARDKLSAAMKGRFFSEETRRKLSIAGKGKKRESPSAETRKKQSDSMKKRTFTPEHRANLSIGNSRRWARERMEKELSEREDNYGTIRNEIR